MQHMNPAATTLIKRMLNAEPSLRPTIAELQTDEFFTGGYCPLRLPTTCLTVPPRFSIAPSQAQELSQRRPLSALDNKGIDSGREGKITSLLFMGGGAFQLIFGTYKAL